MTRKIIHVDMDAFYASVEQRDDPSLRGIPLVVAWSDQPRSVVVTASYEARGFGIHSAMPATRARRLCPHAIFVRPDFDRYRAVSRQVREIFERHTPLVEPLSLDEAYLDVTQELTGLGSATETAKVIREEIRRETQLTASAGVAPNKFLAKIASDWKKPDGIFVIKPHQVEAFLTPLPVKKLPGVGRATEALLAGRNIRTVGDLRQRTLEELTSQFGRFGERLWELSRGIDESPVEAHQEVKSVSVENTFQNDITMQEVAEYLRGAAQEVWDAVTKKELTGRTVTVKLRSASFVTQTRRLTPAEPPAGPDEVIAIANDLLQRFAFDECTLYRLAGVGLSNFLHEDQEPEEEAPALFPATPRQE